jgi:hypothetical protein
VSLVTDYFEFYKIEEKKKREKKKNEKKFVQKHAPKGRERYCSAMASDGTFPPGMVPPPATAVPVSWWQHKNKQCAPNLFIASPEMRCVCVLVRMGLRCSLWPVYDALSS